MRWFASLAVIGLAACGGSSTSASSTGPGNPHATWNVTSAGSAGCLAERWPSLGDEPPAVITCPDGITSDSSLRVVQWQADGACVVELPDGNRPTECPQ